MRILIFLCIFCLCQITVSAQKNKDKAKEFTEDFTIDRCTFSTSGSNTYFVLQPGFQLVLEGTDEKDTVKLVITVLNETKKVGNVETRVVEENESVNGKTIEISRNFFAFCKETGSVFYFGEEVDIYKLGQIVSHDGAWTAEGNNKAGVQMPGLILLGSRYYQEIAPGIAMDRAEILSNTETFITPAGTFTKCLKTEESTAMNQKEKETKMYAPGIGLIQDENLLLVKYGYLK